MKKTALVLVILLVAALIVPSVHAKMKIGVGGDFGLNISTATSDAQGFDTDKKSRNGFMFGGVFVMNFNDWIALQPEVRYSMKGWSWKQTAGNQFDELILKYDYLEIPVYLKFSIPTGIGFGPHFMAGPVFGINLSANFDHKSNVNQPSKGTIANTNSLDLGLGFGAGAHYDFGGHGVFLNFTYNLGLTNINGDQTNFGGASVKNRCLNLGVGYIYTFKK